MNLTNDGPALQAAQLIDAITATSERHIAAIARQLDASDALSAHRLAMVDTLAGNEMNTRTGKIHSITSAELVADESPEGRRLILANREAAAEVSRAHAALLVARLRAELVVRLAGAA